MLRIEQAHTNVFKLWLDVVSLRESCIELPHMLLMAKLIDEGDCFIVETLPLENIQNLVQPFYLCLLFYGKTT